MRILISFFLLCSTAYGQVNLFFPAEKNNIQILAQRFEYELIDKDRFRVGDVIMDASTIEMKIKRNKDDEVANITFHWPAGLAMDGQILLRDNIGKTILSFEIDTSKVKKQSFSTDTSYRNEIASYELENIEVEKIELLKSFPFFKFCVRKEERETKVYVCSKDLYFKSNDKALNISSRDSFRKDSYVEINGKLVGSAGIIFLNEKSDVISLRTLLLSGAILDIDTFRKDIEFKDIVISEDNQNLILRAAGAEPADDTKVSKRSNNEWEAKLAADRPITYLKGGAGIPLRQEFLIEGPVRKDFVKVTTLKTPPLKTYDDELVIVLKKNKKLDYLPNDKDSDIFTTNGDPTWRLKNLEKNVVNRRYLTVSDGENKYFAAYDVLRSTPFELSARISAPLTAEAQLTYWFNVLDLGFSFNYQKILAKTDTEPTSQTMGVDFMFKTPKDINYSDTNYGLMGSYDFLTLEEEKYSIISAGIFVKFKNVNQLPNWIHWLNSELKVPLSISGPNQMKLTTSYQFKSEVLHFFNPMTYVSTGIKLSAFTMKNELTEYSSNKSYLLLGIGRLF